MMRGFWMLCGLVCAGMAFAAQPQGYTLAGTAVVPARAAAEWLGGRWRLIRSRRR